MGLSYTEVLAAASGTISRVQWYDNRPECHGPTLNSACGYGLHIYIQHNNGYITRYAHLSATAFALNISGTSVASGQIIGTSGNTGWTTGPHLHFEVKDQNGGPIDPFNPSLWKDGEWATPSRPIPAPVNGGEIVVDDTTNSTNGFSKGGGGGFQNSCAGDCQGWVSATAGLNSHIYHTPADRVNNPIDQWAQWVPPGIPSGGAVYEVFVYIPDTNATSWQAPYVISHADGISQAVVDQNGLNNQWVSIGTYRMNPGNSVWTHDATGEALGSHCGANAWCELGVDAVKFVRRGTVYAPDTRYSNGWTSEVTLRNNGGGLAKTLVKFLDSNGSVVCSNLPTLSAKQSITLSCNNSQIVATTLDASQDTSLSVTNKRTSSPYSSGSYAGIVANKTSSTFYVPLASRLLASASGQLSNSELEIQNAGTAPVNVNIQMIGAAGVWGNYNKPTVAIPGSGSFNYNLSLENAANLPNGWYGSAVVSVSGSGKIAVISNFRTGSNTVQTFNAFNAESLSTNWRIPLFTSRLANGLSTPIAIQNLSSAMIPINGVTLNCTVDPSSSGTNFTKQNTTAIPVNGAYYFNPVTDTSFQGNWYGSCTLSSGGNNVVSFVQMRYVGAGNTDNAAAYEAMRGNGTDKRAVFPLYQKILTDGSATAVTIQNLSSTSAANVTFVYAGLPNLPANCSASINATIPANGSLIHNHRINSGANSVTQLGTNCSGSLLVTSDQPIDGFIQLTNVNNPAGDTFMAHNAITTP